MKPSLLAPGGKLRGRRCDSHRPCTWLEVAPGLYLAQKRITAMRQLVKRHGCSARVIAAAGFLGDPVLVVVGPKHVYKLRVFRPEQLAMEDRKRVR